MKTTMHAATSRPTRWTAQVAFAILLAGFFAISSLAGASAHPESDALWDYCLELGGQPIEILGPTGEVTESSCIWPSGAVDTIVWSVSGEVGPVKPTAGLSPTGVTVTDLAPVAEPAGKLGAPTKLGLAPKKS